MSGDFDLSTATPVDGGSFDLSSATPAGKSDAELMKLTPRQRLEVMQPSAPPTSETLPTGNPITGAAGTLLGLAQNLGAGIVGNVAAIPTAIRNIGKNNTVAEDRAAEVAGRLSRTPTSQTEKRYTENISNALGSLPPTIGEGMGNAIPLNKLAAKNLAGKAAQAVAPTAESIELARRAQDFGIPLRPDMLYNNKFMSMLGELSEQVPLSGATKEARREAFNKAVIKRIGGDPEATKLSPAVYDAALKRSGSEIGNIAEKYDIPVNSGTFSSIAKVLEDSDKYATPDVHRIVENYVRDLGSKTTEDGVVPGQAFREWNSKLGKQIRTTSNGDLERHLSELRDTMADQLNAVLLPEDQAKLATARKQYAEAKTLGPLVAKSTEGDVTGLMGRVTSDQAGKERMARGWAGDLGDLAKVEQRFLKAPQSSGTAERGLVYTGLGGLGAGSAIAPHVFLPYAAGTWGAANLYNRFGPRIAKAIIGEEPGALTNRGILSNAKKTPRALPPLSTLALPGLIERAAQRSPVTAPLSIPDLQYLQSKEE